MLERDEDAQVSGRPARGSLSTRRVSYEMESVANNQAKAVMFRMEVASICRVIIDAACECQDKDARHLPQRCSSP